MTDVRPDPPLQDRLSAAPHRSLPDPLWWHLALLLAVSIGYESAFIYHGLNLYDEGWPLYSAMRLHAGGVLYQDVFFVFPPGHLLAAWIGYALDPPGIVIARIVYAAFNVSLCVAIYFLGRRLLPASFALLGSLLLAVAAPDTHLYHYHFGYRYLVFSVLALLAFSERLRTGDARWLLAGGMCTGIALCFRLTPAFAVSVAVAVGILLAESDWRRWLRDGGLFAAGLAIVAVPVVTWFAHGIGLEVLWREVVVRPIAMTDLQSIEIPDATLPEFWNRLAINELFTAIQFRAWAILYAGYAAALGYRWARDLKARRPFYPVLLAVVVVWGAVFFLRTQGRSDSGHLESALPPVCLVLAHSLSRLLPWQRRGREREGWTRRLATGGLIVGTLAAWIFLFGTDHLLTSGRLSAAPYESLSGRISVPNDWQTRSLDGRIRRLVERTDPGDTILDLSAAPMVHVLTGRPGPGRFDVVVPGTFLDANEERRFVELLEAHPPAVVVTATKPFDGMASRATSATAPLVAGWLRTHYRIDHVTGDYKLWVPRETPRGE
ncbi:MAG: glycosyltransferase family 39 protein [Deltaproteobacteria bacterium]|nr:glycosyltransferase family 39 protein [Deltaproteobacteria bacterium]